MLKRHLNIAVNRRIRPAAFGRLCVETGLSTPPPTRLVPAAFGRLCVETIITALVVEVLRPAAFGRLCVETLTAKRKEAKLQNQPPSGGCVLKRFGGALFVSLEVPAAFGRLCVETECLAPMPEPCGTSRLRAAVC